MILPTGYIESREGGEQTSDKEKYSVPRTEMETGRPVRK
jgi:hypothetical protein